MFRCESHWSTTTSIASLQIATKIVCSRSLYSGIHFFDELDIDKVEVGVAVTFVDELDAFNEVVA